MRFPIFLSLAAGLFLVAPSNAESPVLQGFQSAATALTPADSETVFQVRREAAACLSVYVKPAGRNHFVHNQPAASKRWHEIAGLRIDHVTAQAVNDADRANGMVGSWLVSVDAAMFRSFDPNANVWSQWHNGRSPFLPADIRVVRDGSGRWSATSPMLKQLVPLSSRRDADLVPHGGMQDAQAAAPPQATAATRQPEVPAKTAVPAKSGLKEAAADAIRKVLAVALGVAILLIAPALAGAGFHLLFRNRQVCHPSTRPPVGQ